MKVAKQAVMYWCMVTGKDWSEFFNNLDVAMSSVENAPLSDDIWLIRKLMSTVEASGISLQEFKTNKDAIKAVFDEDGRKKAGEFFTPEIWCAEGRKYFDKYIPDWREMNMWDGSCYTMDTQLLVEREGYMEWISYSSLKKDDLVCSLNPSMYKPELVRWVNKMETFSDKVYKFYSPYFTLATESMYGTASTKINSAVIDRSLFSEEEYYERQKEQLEYDEEDYDDEEYDDFSGDYETYYKEHQFVLGNKAVLKVTGDHAMWVIKGTFTKTDAEYFSNELEKISARDLYLFLKASDRNFALVQTSTACKMDNSQRMYYSGCRDRNRLILCNNFVKIVELANELGDDMINEAIDNQIYLGCSDNNMNLRYASGDYIDEEVEAYREQYSKLDPRDFVEEVTLSTPEKFWDITLERNHVFLVRISISEIQIFCGNCGSGNLLRTAGVSPDKLFLSSLQEDDITLIRNTPEYAGATAFQCDFLADLDYDIANTEFLNKLPPRLKEVIINDEPLIIYMNPPYKSGSAKSTDVGRYMIDVGLGKSAYDIFYQFCWRVMHFVDMFNLKRCYYAFFGPLTFFTGSSANVLLQEFERCFEFIDGMCISAQEFSDTSDSILWGVGCTLWKSRGGYHTDDKRTPILLEKKFKKPDGSVGCSGRILYEPPRKKLSDWVQPTDMGFLQLAPLMTSHLTFKGVDVGVRKAPNSGRICDNALGTLMIGNTLTRSSDQSAILSMPTTIQFCCITEENFWRCVASYTFRRVYEAGWAVAKKDISAPNTDIEGYDIWLMNALVIFLFDWKSMMSSIRGVEWEGTLYNVRNKLFYCSEDEVRANCQDEKILQDLDESPPCNEFILARIAEAEPYWVEPVRNLYKFCKEYTLFSYNRRKDAEYGGSTDAWDAGFQQIRAGIWNDKLQEQLSGLLNSARGYLRDNIEKFGFVTDIEEE